MKTEEAIQGPTLRLNKRCTDAYDRLIHQDAIDKLCEEAGAKPEHIEELLGDGIEIPGYAISVLDMLAQLRKHYVLEER